VALAAFLKAKRCDIFTDVEGVFTADPRLVENAQKITNLSYEDMLNLSRNGAKVLHPQSVDLAKRHHIPLRVLSSFSFAPGTLISVEGGAYLFGLTYTNGWHLAHASHPFPGECGSGAEAVCVTPQGITYKAVFPPSQGNSPGVGAGAFSPPFLSEKLAAISILTGTCSAENLSSLHRRFLRTLGSAQMPYIEMCSTEARKWQLWVREDDLPSALRFLHNRLQESEDYDHHDVH
jgi:aspartokinase